MGLSEGQKSFQIGLAV